jgi:tetratricopeptide (TPR) repeat protein
VNRPSAALVGAAIVAVAIGCHTTAPVSETRRPPWLVDPRAGLPGPFAPDAGEGWAALSRGDLEVAARIYARARDAASRIGAIEAMAAGGDFDRAHEACGRLFDEGLATAPLLSACGQTEAELGQWADAYELFRDAARKLPGEPGLSPLAAGIALRAVEDRLSRARSATAEGDYGEAAVEAEAALRIAPESLEALKAAREAEEGKEDWDAAFRHAEAAHRLAPGDAELAEAAARLADRTRRFDVAAQIYGELAASEPRFAERAARSREEFIISNWPSEDRAAARAARLTRAQACVLVWRLLPGIRSVAAAASAPVAADILTRRDRKVLSRSIQLGLIGVDASTHRARPDALLTRADAARLLVRAASLVGSDDVRDCLEAGDPADGALTRVVACGWLSSGRGSGISGAELRRALVRIGGAEEVW